MEMLNKSIKKWNIVLGVVLSVFLITSAQAGSFGIGLTGNFASVSADGTETEGETGTETENSVRDATAGNNFGFGSIYAEYAFGEGENFVFGIESIPYSADINSKTLSRTDASQGAYTAQDTGTVKANAEISDHTTYYVELGQGRGFYGKLGYSEVDIKIKQTNSSGYGTYPDKELNAITYGFGYKAGFASNGFIKVEGFYSDYDSYSANSSASNPDGTKNSVSADLDVVGAKLMVGFKF